MSDEKKAKPYKRNPKPLGIEAVKVQTASPHTGEKFIVEADMRHLLDHEFNGLGDFLIGLPELPPDGSGAADLRAMRVKLAKIVVAIRDVDPDDIEEFDGLDTAEKCARYLEAAGNENLVGDLYGTAVAMVRDPNLFRRLQASFAADGAAADAGDPGSGSEGAQLSRVLAGAAAASGSGAAVPEEGS